MHHRLALRLDGRDLANLQAISAALRHAELRAKVTPSDAMRAALALAAKTMAGTQQGTAGATEAPCQPT